jgi:hypothetical protein
MQYAAGSTDATAGVVKATVQSSEGVAAENTVWGLIAVRTEISGETCGAPAFGWLGDQLTGRMSAEQFS